MTGRRWVAVTGASGFLGAHITAALIAAGASVRVLAHHRPPHPLWQHLPVDFFPGSVTDPEACRRFAAGADAVVHAAGLIKALRDTAFSEVNAQGTAALAKAVRNTADCRLVLISSLAAKAPQLSAYAASKLAGEQAAQAAFAGSPGRLAILRPPALYGPWDREGLVMFRALRGRVAPVLGSGRITLMHVEDTARAIAQVAMQSVAGRFALAGPGLATLTTRELMKAVAKAVGGNPWLIPVPAPAVLAAGRLSGWWGRWRGRAEIFNAGKARELLHPDWSVAADEVLPSTVFQPAINLQQGLRGTVKWYRAAGWL
jgi:nucleoside-diphosphate-sugar epimerase